MAVNCWEHFRCEREPGGEKAGKLGVCPAALTFELNGTNSGLAAGRSCWMVAGTLCHGKVDGGPEEKASYCNTCDFRLRVEDEEDRRRRGTLFGRAS